MKNLFTLSAALMVAFSAVAAEDVSVVWAGSEPVFKAAAISPNNKWVCGDHVIWNLESGEIASCTSEEVRLLSVADNGKAVGYVGDFAIVVDPSGSLNFFDDTTFSIYSTARGISADGSIIVGSRFDDAYRQTACYWENGTYHELPVPDAPEDIPADVEIYSLATRGISEDGSVIVGNILTGTSAEAVIMWTRTDSGEYEFHPLYAGLMEFGWEMEKPYIQMSAQSISSNGKWISLILQLNDFDDITYYAGRYNVETGEVECAELPDDNLAYYTGDYYVTGISDNGTAVGFVEQEEMSMFGRQSFIWTSDSDMLELLSTYCDGNTEISALENNDALVYTAINGNSDIITGFTVIDGVSNSFVINLDSSHSAVSTIETGKEDIKSMYDLQGRPVNGKPAPGIYIVTEVGKTHKVLVK
ncbi:MAG: hypothetical protein K2J24_03440 [Muribaculaceae bacterium]|nr:hypothetical protein [Muribaculaceae bacterium]